MITKHIDEIGQELASRELSESEADHLIQLIRTRVRRPGLTIGCTVLIPGVVQGDGVGERGRRMVNVQCIFGGNNWCYEDQL